MTVLYISALNYLARAELRPGVQPAVIDRAPEDCKFTGIAAHRGALVVALGGAVGCELRWYPLCPAPLLGRAMHRCTIPDVREPHDLRLAADKLHVVSTGTEEIVVVEATTGRVLDRWRFGTVRRDVTHINSVAYLDGCWLVSHRKPRARQLHRVRCCCVYGFRLDLLHG